LSLSDITRWLIQRLSHFTSGLWLPEFLRRCAASSAHSNCHDAATEDALKALHTLQTIKEWSTGAALAQRIGVTETAARATVASLVACGWVQSEDQDRLYLSEAGKARARELIRAHRLWERYLVDREGVPLEAVHAEADRREHKITPQDLVNLDADLGQPAWDPHGHVIPAPGHPVPPIMARSLAEEGSAGRHFRIISLDDEPTEVLARLIALGLNPGIDVEILEQAPDYLRLGLDENTIALDIADAHHVFVVPTPSLAVPLGELPIASQARVAEVRGAGKHQRRMLDMGFVPGALVTVARQAPLGDPVEFRIKGTSVALRRQDANTILVEELSND